MKYWSYNDYTDPDDPAGSSVVVTKSEDEIIAEYWPDWYKRGCAAKGEQWMKDYMTPSDCIDDWVVVNWAWESTGDGSVYKTEL
jgi:hypothetical protein